MATTHQPMQLSLKRDRHWVVLRSRTAVVNNTSSAHEVQISTPSMERGGPDTV